MSEPVPLRPDFPEQGAFRQPDPDTYHHLIDSIHNIEHLCPGDVPVAVHVVKSECPWTQWITSVHLQAIPTAKLLVKIASTGDGEGSDKLVKLNGPILK